MRSDSELLAISDQVRMSEEKQATDQTKGYKQQCTLRLRRRNYYSCLGF